MTAETPAPEAKPPKAKPAKRLFDPQTMRLVEGVPEPPVLLWESLLSASQVIILAAFLSVALLSVLAGVMWWMVFLRVGATLLGLALILWLINWLVARGALEAAQKEARTHLENKQRALAENPPATVELEA